MAASNRPRDFATVEECVEAVIATVGRRIVLGAPLGLGKPNQLMNAFFQRVAGDPDLELIIFTALSLEIPKPSNDIEARLLEPFIARHFGDYVELDYMKAIRAGELPANVTVHEFYFRAGSMKNVETAQRHYISTNYTYVARDLLDRGVNVLVQLVAEKEIDGRPLFSLSCNTDVTLDLVSMLRAEGREFVTVAQVHGDLPFMYNRAIVEPALFDYVVRNPSYDTTLFATPNPSVSAADFAIGLHVGALLKDGGTLQIGIGSLGDAIVYASRLRHEDNGAYRATLAELGADATAAATIGGLEPFAQGLYGCSEMFVNGFLHLRRAGILVREVFDDAPLQRALNETGGDRADVAGILRALLGAGVVGPALSRRDVDYLRHWGILRPEVELDGETLRVGAAALAVDLGDPGNLERLQRLALGAALRGGIFMHGAFFLGPPDFYAALRSMPRAEAQQIAMDSVRRINRVDDPELRNLQRRHARFINTAMMVTLFGAVVSDGLEDGQVVSGVGGQYNFVAQAHELPGARSIITLRATRGRGRDTRSNIVPHYGHVTVPRHLRDIVVTEYGVADLRGKSDEEIVQALLEVADSRFQEELRETAVKAGKLDPSYRIPEARRANTPERIGAVIEGGRSRGLFPAFPLGTELTDDEIALAGSLRDIKDLMDDPKALIRAVIRSFLQNVDEERAAPYLERIGLQHPDTPKEVILRHLLLLELEDHGHLRPL
jgi:acyl-CoA hydrolase